MSDEPSILDTAVGAEALVTLPLRTQGVRFRVRCKVFGWRRSYGHVEFNVSPVNGEGGAWIRSQNMEIGK